MAGIYDQLKILQDHAYTSYRYEDTTHRQILGAASGGTVVVESRPPTSGNFYERVRWGNDGDIIKGAKPNVQTDHQSYSEPKQVSIFDVKTGAVADPYAWQSVGMEWIGRSDAELASLYGETVGESMALYKTKFIISALIACFARGLLSSGKDTVVESVIDDQSGTTANVANKLDAKKLYLAKRKFSDRSGLLGGAIMHGEAFFTMQERNFDLFQQLFSYGDIVVYRGPDGAPIYVSDVPALKFVESSVTKYRTLILRPRSAIIYNVGDFKIRFDPDRLGKTWLETTAQAQETFSVSIDGFTWADTTKVHPLIGTTNATGKLAGLHTDSGVIDNPASWARVGVAEGKGITAKQLPGVMLLTQ